MKAPETSALEIAETAIEGRGLELHDVDVDVPNLRGFAFPNPFVGGFSEAVVRDYPDLSMLVLSVRLTEGQVEPCLRDGLLQLINALHYEKPGVVFSYDQDDEDGDEVEMAMFLPYGDPEDVALLIDRHLPYMQKVHERCVPLVFTFLTQRLRGRADTNGVIKDLQPTVSVDEVMQMLELGTIGRA